MTNRVAGKIKLQSVDQLLGVPEISGTQEIEIVRIHAFPNHPFKVLDDERMDMLVDSIRENGILNPVIVRPDQNGDYEMVSGHRRLHAAGIAGLQKIPAIVKEMSDDEAIINMVDANIQREEILPSERAFSFKMKLDAIRRQGARADLTLGTEFPKLDENSKRTRNQIGMEAGISGRQVTKYIRLTELISTILDLVDSKKITLTMGVDISYLDEQIQKWVYEYSVISIMNDALPKKNTAAKVSFSEKKLDKYFPSNYSAKDRETVIIQLLEQWSEAQREIQ